MPANPMTAREAVLKALKSALARLRVAEHQATQVGDRMQAEAHLKVADEVEQALSAFAATLSDAPEAGERPQFHRVKVDKLIDLISRACANCTHDEVADAVAMDWFPTIEIDTDGKPNVVISAQPAPKGAI